LNLKIRHKQRCPPKPLRQAPLLAVLVKYTRFAYFHFDLKIHFFKKKTRGFNKKKNYIKNFFSNSNSNSNSKTSKKEKKRKMSQTKKQRVNYLNHTIVRDGVTLWRCNPCDDHHPKESFGQWGLKKKMCKIAQKKRDESKNCVKCKKVRASYGLSDRGKATHCKSCKTTEMVDVVSKRCNCAEAQRAIYALPGDPPSCCKSCKQPGMVDVVNKRCAYIVDEGENNRRQCDKLAQGATDYCLEHGGGKKCERDGCGVVVYKKDKEKRFCYKHYHQFHKTEHLMRRKIKEEYFHKALVENFKQLKFTRNKALHFVKDVQPDWYILLRLFHLIIELDQGQHKDKTLYPEGKDIKKTKSIVDNLPDDRPLVLIRINPDCYINKKGEKIRGIWNHRLTKFNQDEFNRRFNLLAETIQGFLDLKQRPNEKLTEIKLFFDGFDL
jgi:hypothetical protein